jgi:hypothetical protein
MNVEQQLRAAIDEHVGAAPVPPADLDAVRSRGQAVRRRRTTGLAAAAVVLVVTVGGAVAALDGSADRTRSDAPEPITGLDYSSGLRAFASPDADGELWLGGRAMPRRERAYLDTDAVATSFGLVWFDRAEGATLLREDGTEEPLGTGPASGLPGFRPSAKADASRPWVALTSAGDDAVTVHVYDGEAGRVVATTDAPCGDRPKCQVTVDSLDQGMVFLRQADGTVVWDVERDTLTPFGPPDLRVADVRNGRVLWTGARPDPGPRSPVAGWPLTEGEIDAELSYDGRHVLYWSPVLEPTEPGGEPVRLDVDGAIWFTFDTDGSVLAASQGRGSSAVVHDCEVPSGRCTEIGTIATRSGDPMFIGNDM